MLILVVLAGTSASALAAAGIADEWAPLLNLGAVGLFMVLFLTGRVHSEKEMASVRKERDDAVEDARKLRDTLITQAVPAMTRITEATTKATEALMKRSR